VELPTVEQIRETAIAIDPKFAKAVARWDIEVGRDWQGDPGVFVIIVLKDSEAHRVWESRRDYKDRLRNRLWAMLPEGYFPYITYSAESVALDPEIPARR